MLEPARDPCTCPKLTLLLAVGIVFAAVLATAFFIGISATVYCAWVQPAFARYQLRRKLRKQRTDKSSLSPESSPDKKNHQLNTPSLSSPTKDLEKGESIFVKEVEAVDDELALPQPAFLLAKNDRFSTSTRDGVWWIV